MNGDYTVQSSSVVISRPEQRIHICSVCVVVKSIHGISACRFCSSVNGNFTESTFKSHDFSESNPTTSEWPIWDAKWMGNISSTQLFL